MGTSEQLEGGLSGGAARLTASAGETPAGRLSGDTTELGIDIISVGRIRRTLARFGGRFVRRVLTPSEQRYVRDRAETLAGGRYLFPPDIEDRLDDRERRILARIERLRALAAEDDGTGASRA